MNNAIRCMSCPSSTLLALLFADELFDDFDVFALVARLVACVDVTDHAVAVDDYAARHRLEFVHSADFLAVIDEYGKRNAGFASHFLCRAFLAFDVDAENREACVVITLVNLLQQRHFLPAWSAPTRPEIDQHDLPAIFVQTQVFAVDALEHEIGCDILHRHCVREHGHTYAHNGDQTYQLHGCFLFLFQGRRSNMPSKVPAPPTTAPGEASEFRLG